jgi:ankyrin repeat protein
MMKTVSKIVLMTLALGSLESVQAMELAKEKVTQELFSAVSIYDLAKVTDLLNQGADINARDARGRTPLINGCADIKLSDPIVEMLIDRGADLNIQDLSGYSALMEAAECNKITAVKKMLAKKADLELRDKKGNTALRWAIARDNKEVAQELINAGANINSVANDGTTLLMSAVYKSPGMFKIILDGNPELSLVNKNNETVLDIIGKTKTYEGRAIQGPNQMMHLLKKHLAARVAHNNQQAQATAQPVLTAVGVKNQGLQDLIMDYCGNAPYPFDEEVEIRFRPKTKNQPTICFVKTDQQ